jgi:hypothetical protein
MNRIIVATQAVALLLAAQVAPVEGQTILVDATVSLPPVEARVVVGSDHGRVRVPEARRRSPRANARMREALRQAERDFLRDLRRAKRNLHERLERADRKLRRDRRRFGRSVALRKHRRAVRQAEHRYQQEVRRAEYRYEARQRAIRRRFRHRSYRFR